MGSLNSYQAETYKTYIFARKLFLNTLDVADRHKAARKIDQLLIDVAKGEAELKDVGDVLVLKTGKDQGLDQAHASWLIRYFDRLSEGQSRGKPPRTNEYKPSARAQHVKARRGLRNPAPLEYRQLRPGK
jgi:hypothetical protein